MARYNRGYFTCPTWFAFHAPVMALLVSSAKVSAEPVDFHHAFQPLVAEYCLACHDEYGAVETSSS